MPIRHFHKVTLAEKESTRSPEKDWENKNVYSQRFDNALCRCFQVIVQQMSNTLVETSLILLQLEVYLFYSVLCRDKHLQSVSNLNVSFSGT